jgi:serine/threonine-protein kinase
MPPVEPTGDLAAGTIILGRYRIDGVLGRGGMGVVYAAHHTFMDQRVALKLLSSQALASPDAAQRFLNEARNAAKIPGENVCRILDVGLLETGMPYIAMEYLEGQSLEAIAIERKFVEPQEASRWVLEALVAVAHAHARGIVHRDLKPSNLLLAQREDGSTVVKVLDFGISKSLNASQQGLTTTRGFLGSPTYMAPEHIRSPRTVDARVDIWSLGVVLYELSSGFPPYDAAELGELLAAILESEPAPLASRRAGLPADFCAVVHRCLAKNRDARFQGVAELAEALAPFAGDGASALAERVRKALATRPESKPRTGLADGSGSLPAVATGTGSGPHSGPVTSDVRPEPPVPHTPVVATTGTALTHSTAHPARRQRSAAWIAGAAGLLGGIAIAMTIALSARRRAPAEATPASAVAATTSVASAPATVTPLPDPGPAQAGASAMPAEPTTRSPSAASSASARPPSTPPRRPSSRPSSGGKASGLSTSRD